MTNSVTLGSVIRAEWIKFRSVRSTMWGYLVTLLLTWGIGILITSAIRSQWATFDPIRKLVFDPVSKSLAGTLFAQLAVGVIGVLFIASEYSSGSIRTTLSAVPNRTQLVLGKVIVLGVTTIIFCEIVCVGAFLIGQRIFSGVVPTASLANGAVLRSVLFAGVYLTLLAIFGFSLGLIVRVQSAAISIFASLLLVVPIVDFLLPLNWQTHITKFQPSALGRAMMSTLPPDQLFNAGTALAILSAYVAVVFAAGLIIMNRRDA